MKTLMLGNEAVARGAFEGGCGFGSGYPGTPSTEIIEYLAPYENVRVQWGPNEKVGLEVAVGASMAGVRSIATMKHVGLNVAADPFFSVSYMAVNGGLVVVSADEPAMHSSQNEQDNRRLAKAAKCLMVEPADAEESRWMMREALALSEEFDSAILFRMTTRVCHQTGVVNLEDPVTPPPAEYKKDIMKFILLPAHARLRRHEVEKRLEAAAAFGNESDHWNPIYEGSGDLGVITSGVSFGYVRETAPDASILKLGLTNPLPMDRIKKFAASVKRLIIVEELDPVLEEQIKAEGIEAEGQSLRPYFGELNLPLVEEMLAGGARNKVTVSLEGIDIPKRPPTLCPGCGHRPVFKVLRDMRLHVMGDIGCYTLGALKPLSAMETCLCMGGSIGMSEGLDLFGGEGVSGKVVGVIGDSTFFHSGITGLLDMVVNGSKATILILDNGTTAMTGAQPHPGTGVDIRGGEAPQIDPAEVCRGIGVKRVVVVDPYDMENLEKVLTEELEAPELSVVVVRAPCVLNERVTFADPVQLDRERCNQCGLCIRVGCMAIREKDGYPEILADLCNGCGVCAQVCPEGALTIPEKVSS
ncbi:MAG: thiamine pyrophosphate-dependent enzyme [Candidatus Zixiibacteriota bacterium]|jgi:indolepyruvate ferredoxin oxidoreductase alpha subunit